MAPDAEPPAAHPAAPVAIGLTYYGDAFDTVSGGIEPGWAYEGRLGLLFDADLGRLLGWQGAHVHASIHQIHGEQPTPAHVGALAALSGIEAEPNTRLFNLSIEQTLTPGARLKLGQFTAGQEFAISPTAGLFVNSTFGWPDILAQDLPSGGPAYPIGALGARFSYTAPHGAVLLAVFNGDPAGPGAGDPQHRDRYGLNSFRLSGGPFVIGEAQLDVPATTTKVRFGAWWLDRRAPSQPLVPPSAPGAPPPASKQGDWGAYAIVDGVIAQKGHRSLAGFARLAVTPGDRNLISAYVDGGVTLTGLIAGRPDDRLGLAASFSRISPAAMNADALAAGLGQLLVRRDYEAVVEATYQSQITSHWSLQPDLQFVIHPGGHVPLPTPIQSRRAIPDALVVGLRNVVRF
ncbi:MAG TPA: carbohydrate porin [Caulobacteraceae bacterium]